MKTQNKFKIWLLAAQDKIMIAVIFALCLLFSLGFNNFDFIKSDAELYPKDSPLNYAEYEIVYTHPRYSDATPRVNGVKYDLNFLVNGEPRQQQVFTKKYEREICNLIDQQQWSSLIVQYDPENLEKVKISRIE